MLQRRKMCRRKTRVAHAKMKTAAAAKVTLSRRSQQPRTMLNKLSILGTHLGGQVYLHLRQGAGGLLAALTQMMTTKAHLQQSLLAVLRKQNHLKNQRKRKGEATEQSVVDHLARRIRLKMTETSRAEVGAEVSRKGRALDFLGRTGHAVPAEAGAALRARI